MAGFGMAILGGALEQVGTGIADRGKALREAKLRQLEQEREFQFRSSEAGVSRDAQVTENKRQEGVQAANAQGEMIDLGGGKMGVRKGSKVEPLTYGTGGSVSVEVKNGYRQLTPEEVEARGLDPKKAYQIALSGDDKDKVSAIGGGDTSISIDSGKLTEVQSKDVGFFSRGLYANADLSTMDQELTSLGGNVAGRFGVPGNYYKDPKYRQAERAGKDFLAIMLRKDSGAAVTDNEFDHYGQIYLPWPGDDQKTVEDKRSARVRALDGIELGLGTARPIAKQIREEFDTKYKKDAGGAASQPPTPGAVEDGYRFKGGNPADPNSWERAQ